MTAEEISKTYQCQEQEHKSLLLVVSLLIQTCMYSGLTYCIAMSVILLCVTFLTWRNDIQGIHLTIQHQSPAHFLSSRISLPYQSFVWGGELRFTGSLSCVLLLGKHRPYRELWTGVHVDLSADLVHFQMSQDWVLNRVVTLEENTVSCVSFFQPERKYIKKDNPP